MPAIGSPFKIESAALTFTGSGAPVIQAGPNPRTAWRVLLGGASGGYDIDMTEAQSRRLSARLTDPSELRYTINGTHAQAAAIEELATDNHVLWTSPDTNVTYLMFRGRIGPTGDAITETEHRTTVSALDYRALLQRRRLFSGDTVTWTGVDQGEIAWGLVQQTQGNTAGDLGISKAWTGTAPTGITRDRTYELGDSIGERIQELSETIDGFDWDVLPVSASGLLLQVWSPQRGVSRGVVLEYGGLVASANREVQPSAYANAIRMTGADTTTPQEREADDLASLPEGRWDAVFGDSGLTTQSALDDRIHWQRKQSQTLRPPWTVTLKRGGWKGPDHIWLGDTVQLVVRSGARLQTNTFLRVFEISFDIDAEGGETVTLTLDAPKPDYRRVPALTDRRLGNLERR